MESRMVSATIMILLFASFCVGVHKVEAGFDTRVYVDPPAISGPPGSTFSFDIVLADVFEYYGGEITLFWNSSVLKCVADVVHIPSGCNWEEPNNMKLGPGIDQDYNETHGRYYRGFCAIPIQEPHPILFSGTTVLVTLTFKVEGVGRCALDLRNTKFSGYDCLAIHHTIEDGYFESEPPPPETEITVDASGRYDADSKIFVLPTTTFALNPTDDESVDYTSFRIDDGVWMNYSEPFTLAGYGDGQHTIQYFSTPEAGSVESIKTISVTLDNESPATTYSPSDGTYSETIAVNLTATDKGSGVKEVYYRTEEAEWTIYTGPFNITQPGDYTVFYYSMDNLGNKEDAKTISYTIKASTAPLFWVAIIILLTAIATSIIVLARRTKKT